MYVSAGGSGIHRDLGNKRKAETEPGAEYRAKVSINIF